MKPPEASILFKFLDFKVAAAKVTAAESVHRECMRMIRRLQLKSLFLGAVTGQGLFVRVGVCCCRMFVSFFAMLVSRSRVMLGVLVFPAGVRER